MWEAESRLPSVWPEIKAYTAVGVGCLRLFEKIIWDVWSQVPDFPVAHFIM